MTYEFKGYNWRHKYGHFSHIGYKITRWIKILEGMSTLREEKKPEDFQHLRGSDISSQREHSVTQNGHSDRIVCIVKMDLVGVGGKEGTLVRRNLYKKEPKIFCSF